MGVKEGTGNTQSVKRPVSPSGPESRSHFAPPGAIYTRKYPERPSGVRPAEAILPTQRYFDRAPRRFYLHNDIENEIEKRKTKTKAKTKSKNEKRNRNQKTKSKSKAKNENEKRKTKSISKNENENEIEK